MTSPPAPPGPPPGLPPSGRRQPTGNANEQSETRVPSTSTASGLKREVVEMPEDPIEMEKKLSRERMLFFQELEMDRVLNAFKLNPYDVLECPMEADEKSITKIYRRKSLLIHPDKVKDPRAESAFALLKQASTHLLDEEKRKALDEVVMLARSLCLKELGLAVGTESNDERLQNLVPSFHERVRKGTREIMIDDELRKRRAVRLQHAAEGEQSRKREEAAAERKRKADENEQWESNRDDRINNWRDFQRGAAQKTKKKSKKEGRIQTLG